MENSEATFKSLQDLTKNAIYFKQQLKYEESRRWVLISFNII